MRDNKNNGYNNANLKMETLILPEKIEEGWVVFDEEKFLKSLPDGMQYYAIDEKNETIYGLGKDYNKRIEKLEDELFAEKRHHEKVANALLNYKDKVSELTSKLILIKKALALAVETLRFELGREAIKNLYKDALQNLSNNLNMKFDEEMSEWFIKQAEEVMRDETKIKI